MLKIVVWHGDFLISANVYGFIDNIVDVPGHACAVSALEEYGSGMVVRTNGTIVWWVRKEVSLKGFAVGAGLRLDPLLAEHEFG